MRPADSEENDDGCMMQRCSAGPVRENTRVPTCRMLTVQTDILDQVV
jgi:hypothetical protein